MYRPCDQCGSAAVVLSSMANDLMEQNGLTKEDCFDPPAPPRKMAVPDLEVTSEPKSVEDILDDMKRQSRNKRKARRRKLRKKGR